jgi:mutator family transposase
VRLAVMMIDGLELQGRTNVVALGITTEGVKIPLGLWEGSTENATVTTALLSDLVERGLDAEQGILFVIDGAKALQKAIRNVFGDAPVQRCVRHKERNVTDHLPERERPAVKQPPDRHTGTAATKFHGARDILPPVRDSTQAKVRGLAAPHLHVVLRPYVIARYGFCVRLSGATTGLPKAAPPSCCT